MPVIEAVSWINAEPNQVAYRFPKSSLKYGSQVIVMENQWAIFFRDGKVLDKFGPGRHTITSANIPLLTDLLKRIGLIGDIFECEVVFVNNSQLRGNFGGQAYSAPSGQIAYQAEVNFYGYILYRVEDPQLFVTEFFGNRNASTSLDVENYLRGFIVERVIDAFGGYDITNLVRNVDEVTNKTALVINNEAKRAGLSVIDAVFEGIKIPEEARRFASGIGQQAMAMQYAKETAQALPPDSGAAGAGLGAGIGLGLGAQMIKGMQVESVSQRVVVCPSCGAQIPEGNKFCGQCGKTLQPVTTKCPSCGSDNPQQNKFCGVCGKTMTFTELKCSKCGAKNQPGLKFCGNCGEKLG